MENDEHIEEKLKNHRAENAAKSIGVRIIYTAIIVFGPFALRTVFIRVMGTEYSGLNSVFQTIVSLLNIAEMGFGQVMVYFLLEPLAGGDTIQVNKILNTMRRIYCYIGLIVLLLGILFSFVIPLITKTGFISNGKQRFFFIIFILSGILQYFFYMETVSLLNALQQQYVSWIIVSITNAVMYLLQAMAVLLFHSYLLYVCIPVLMTLISSIMRKVYVTKRYPRFTPSGYVSQDLVKEIKQKTYSMLGHQIETKLLDSVDNVFISAILGLTMVTIYGNYYYIVSAVSLFTSIVFNTLVSAIGNAMVTESIQSNYFRFKCLNLLNAVIVGWATLCMLMSYQNFMHIWMPEYLLSNHSVVLLCIYFYFANIRSTVRLFKNSAGLWYNDRWKPYVSMLADIFMDIVFIRLWGVNGAVISSIICVCIIEYPWETRVLFRDYFKRDYSEYIKDMAWYAAVNFLLILGTYVVINKFISDYGFFSLAVRLMISTVASCVLYFLAYKGRPEYQTWLDTVRRVVRRRTDGNA